MTHPITTIEGQLAETVQRLPNIVTQTRRLLDAVDTDELHRVLAARMISGHTVFGARMFTWEAGDLWTEFIEELADALAYGIAYLWVADNGPLQNPDVSENANQSSIIVSSDGNTGIGW